MPEEGTRCQKSDVRCQMSALGRSKVWVLVAQDDAAPRMVLPCLAFQANRKGNVEANVEETKQGGGGTGRGKAERVVAGARTKAAVLWRVDAWRGMKGWVDGEGRLQRFPAWELRVERSSLGVVEIAYMNYFHRSVGRRAGGGY